MRHPLFFFLALFFLEAGWCQNGPYPPLSFPATPEWQMLDSNKTVHYFPAALVWQPARIGSWHGFVISPQGLALIPAEALDSTLLRPGTWLETGNGRKIDLPEAEKLAVTTQISDLSATVLLGVPDSVSADTRAVKIANRLLELGWKPGNSEAYQISPFYLGNRYYRQDWAYQQTLLIGQLETESGRRFALIRLLPEKVQHAEPFKFLPISTTVRPQDSILFLFGHQQLPGQYLTPKALEAYYTDLLPLLKEAQFAVQSQWARKGNLPDWLERLELTDELASPLHPFAEVNIAVREAHRREEALLNELSDRSVAWQHFFSLQQHIQEAERNFYHYEKARMLAKELIPSYLQLFRLVRFLDQMEKLTIQDPAGLEKRQQSILAFLRLFYQNFDATADQAAAAQLFNLYFSRLKVDLLSPYAVDQYLFAGKDFNNLAALVYQKSKLVNGKRQIDAAQKDLRSYLEGVKQDYAYQFFQHWMNETQSLVIDPFNKQKKTLADWRRKMLKGMLDHLPTGAPIEKGFISYTRLPVSKDGSWTEVSPHYLGNYPAMSPVMAVDGQVIGFTTYEGSNPFLQGSVSNKIVSTAIFQILKDQFPDHPVVLEIFGKE